MLSSPRLLEAMAALLMVTYHQEKCLDREESPRL